MKFDYKKVAIIGIKIAILAVGSYLFYRETKEEFVKKKETPENKSTEKSSFQAGEENTVEHYSRPSEKKESKFVTGLKSATTFMSGALGVISLTTKVSNGIESLFKDGSDADNYFYYGGDYFGGPGYIPGNYPWNRPEDSGLPFNTPIYRGRDSRNDDVYWIKRPNGITEVW